MVNMLLTSSLARPIYPYSRHLFAVACCIFKVSPDLQALMSYPCLQKLTIYNIKIYAEHIKYTYIHFLLIQTKNFQEEGHTARSNIINTLFPVHNDALEKLIVKQNITI